VVPANTHSILSAPPNTTPENQEAAPPTAQPETPPQENAQPQQ